MKTAKQFLEENTGKEIFAEDLSTAMLIYLCGHDNDMVANYVKHNITILFHKPKLTS